jgi:FKBP-type peptidyl-prolyl cis-trans isomerase
MLTTLFAASVLLRDPEISIKEIKAGTGAPAVAKDRVVVQYTGKLNDGKVFDSSVKSAPLVVTLGAKEVIAGFDQGLTGMKLGGKRTITIPPELGYGAQALDGIPANSTLNFDVEILAIERPADTPKITLKVLAKGTGEPGKPGEEIFVHYRVTFVNDVLIQDSKESKKPLNIIVGQEKFIPGFVEGLKDIRLGEKRSIYIPSALAYGARERGPIPPNSPLKFVIERVVKP